LKEVTVEYTFAMKRSRWGGVRAIVVHCLVVLNLSGNRICHGRQGFRRFFGVLRIRGGEESYPTPQDQREHYQYDSYRDSFSSPDDKTNQANVSELTGEEPDITSSSNRQFDHQFEHFYPSHVPVNDDQSMHNSMYLPQRQHEEDQMSSQYYRHQTHQQQQQQGPPQLPPGDYGDGDFDDVGLEPLPMGYSSSLDPRLMGRPPPLDEASLFQDLPGGDSKTTVGTTFGMDHNPDNSGMDLSSFDKEYILKGLARLYRKKILPLEISSRYGHFHSPTLSPADFVAPPMVLLLGQYRYEWIQRERT
jgi:hypothetical protein